MRRLAVTILVLILSAMTLTLTLTGPLLADGATGAAAARSVPGRAGDANPDDVQRAIAEYAKLRAKLHNAVTAIKARFQALRRQAKQCLAGGNPACLLQLQAAMSGYETFIETESQLIASWQGLIQKILQNIH